MLDTATPATDVTVRPYKRGDFVFLCEMLYEAVYWRPEQPRPALRVMMRLPHLGHYVQGWGRDGDTALLAVTPEGQRVGAAWYRFFPATAPGYGFIDPAFPEISVGVAPAWRGQGIGGLLLTALIETAQEQTVPALSLSVENENAAACRLYERHGFAPVQQESSEALTLLLPLTPEVTFSRRAGTGLSLCHRENTDSDTEVPSSASPVSSS